ncbi:MAG: response regulator [Candidatus Omnitrophota bacterium]
MSGHEKRLLIIDDEDDICQIVKEKFENLGYKVLTANTTHEGFKKTEQDKPDCVILDIRIPGREGGLGYLQRLRSYLHNDPEKQARMRETPVIVLTGAGVVMQPLFEQQGISGFIEKPLDFTKLQAQIQNIVWKH